MITKFEKFNLIIESPDFITLTEDGEEKEYLWSDGNTKPFFIEVNSDHTKVKKLYVGSFRTKHSDIKFKCDYSERAYPGRIWMDEKIISFWVYPNKTLFIDIIKNLEKRLRRKIFNITGGHRGSIGGWRIEVIKDGNDDIIRNEFDTDDEYADYYGQNKRSRYYDIIPIEKYIGSENPTEEEHIMHMMNWKEKALAKKAGKLNIKGWGSDKTAWDSPHNIKWRQALYQEKKNN